MLSQLNLSPLTIDLNARKRAINVDHNTIRKAILGLDSTMKREKIQNPSAWFVGSLREQRKAAELKNGHKPFVTTFCPFLLGAETEISIFWAPVDKYQTISTFILLKSKLLCGRLYQRTQISPDLPLTHKHHFVCFLFEQTGKLDRKSGFSSIAYNLLRIVKWWKLHFSLNFDKATGKRTNQILQVTKHENQQKLGENRAVKS